MKKKEKIEIKIKTHKSKKIQNPRKFKTQKKKENKNKPRKFIPLSLPNLHTQTTDLIHYFRPSTQLSLNLPKKTKKSFLFSHIIAFTFLPFLSKQTKIT